MTVKKRIIQLGLGVVAAALLATVQPCSASAQEVLFAETIQVERYTGTFQKEFHIDIDDDGEKEAIGYYYVGSADRYAISDIYSVYDNDSESYVLYKAIVNQHMQYKFHIIQDKNTGETFLGYIYTDMFGSEMLYRFYSDNQSKLISSYNANTDGSDKLQAYKTYMNNVHFLDEAAYGHGDVDGDADVTVSDAVAILSYYAATAAGQSPSFTEPQKKAADFNQDGIVTVEDAVKTLSLYAKHAAGIIDTVLLPATIRRDSTIHSNFSDINVATTSNPFPLKEGTLESTFYLDINGDGKEETIGRYKIHSYGNLELCYDCIFQVYNNGKFEDSFGDIVESSNEYTKSTMLIYDHNTDKVYFSIYFSFIIDSSNYINLGSTYSHIDSSCLEINVINTDGIYINGKEATEQELYDYLNQIEIISSNSDENQILNDCKYVLTTH